MPKYWVKNYFAHGSFPEVGQKQKTEKKKERKKDWTMVITMAKLRMAHASCLGQQNIATLGLNGLPNTGWSSNNHNFTSNTDYTRHWHNSHTKSIQNCWKEVSSSDCNVLSMDCMNYSSYPADGSIADTFFVNPNHWRIQLDKTFIYSASTILHHMSI